jgi:TRAP-type C4-dicarboxylate transport system permease small subunit
MNWQETLPPPLKLLSRCIDGAIVVCGAGIVVIIFGNAFLRFITNMDVAWSRELATFLMLWVTFLGCAAAAARGAHMRVTEIAAHLLSPRAHRWLEVGINLVVSAVLLSIIWYGTRIAIRTWDQETTILYWPVGLLYASMPAGTFLTLLFVINQTARLVGSATPSTSPTE